MSTLLLVAHGSHLNPNSARAAEQYAAQLREQGLYRAVTVCYWKEEPSLRQVLRTVSGTAVTVLPAFMSEGYFTETVIPRELGLRHQGPVPAEGVREQVGGKNVHYLRPYGTHLAMQDVILARAREVLPESRWREAALLVLGHGTTENDHSRAAIASNAGQLRRRGLFAAVHEFYLDEEPRVAGWAKTVTAPEVVIVPFFASEGWHTQETIPQELALTGEQTRLGGQTVYYARPVGTHPLVADVILQLAADAARVAPAPDLDDPDHKGAWAALPAGDFVLGEVQVQRRGERVLLRHKADAGIPLRRLCTLSELREATRRTAERQHRPIRTFANLPGGWQAHLAAQDLPAALHLLYPAVIEERHRHALGQLPVTSWAGTAARQTGLYRTVQDATPAQVQAEVAATCGNCLRQPLWAGAPVAASVAAHTFPCAEACTLLVAGVRDRVNAEKPRQQASRTVPAGARVTLVGAGPGDPELLTLGGLRALEQADVVLYDALVNPLLLAHAPQAEQIHVGKRGFGEAVPQDEINRLLIEKAVQDTGKQVVRLKGGDPFVFGRGGEEALACKVAGVPFAVVPGISSALGGPAYAGIRVTHRGVARSFAVLTGQEQGGVAHYRELGSVDTLVFLMAVKNLEQICADLLAAGRSPATPVATIQSATLPGQRVVTGTLADIALKARQAGIQAPALTVVGEVVRLRDSLDWFSPTAFSPRALAAKGPLAGRNIVVTRTRAGHPSTLAALLREQGATVSELPLLRYGPPASRKTVVGALQGFSGWAALTSEQAVHALLETLSAEGLDARALGGVKLAAAGQGTARALLQRGLKADFVAAPAGAAQLGAQLPARPGDLVVHLGPQHEEQALKDALERRGLDYLLVETFRADPVELAAADLSRLQRADVITLASAAGTRAFAQVAGTDWPVTVIGPQTAAAARGLGFGRIVQARDATLAGLVEASRSQIQV